MRLVLYIAVRLLACYLVFLSRVAADEVDPTYFTLMEVIRPEAACLHIPEERELSSSIFFPSRAQFLHTWATQHLFHVKTKSLLSLPSSSSHRLYVAETRDEDLMTAINERSFSRWLRES